MGHHPPGHPDYIVSRGWMLTDILQDYADIIVLHVTGHQHEDDFRMVCLMLVLLVYCHKGL